MACLLLLISPNVCQAPRKAERQWHCPVVGAVCVFGVHNQLGVYMDLLQPSAPDEGRF